jgi:hypothetical protein
MASISTARGGLRGALGSRLGRSRCRERRGFVDAREHGGEFLPTVPRREVPLAEGPARIRHSDKMKIP